MEGNALCGAVGTALTGGGCVLVSAGGICVHTPSCTHTKLCAPVHTHVHARDTALTPAGARGSGQMGTGQRREAASALSRKAGSPAAAHGRREHRPMAQPGWKEFSPCRRSRL